MATLKQIEANRLNAQKSTGPRSPEGKAAIRFNALKSGIDAKSQVIPGEDPAALELLTAEYYDHYQPATPEVRALVDTLITAEWLQRRFRTLEARLWEHIIRNTRNPDKGLEVAQTYDDHSGVFHHLQRRIDAAERSYHRALVALQKIESHAPQPTPPAPEPHLDPDPRPRPAEAAGTPPDPWPPERSEPEIGFVPSTPPSVASRAIRLTSVPGPIVRHGPPRL
jgi:hypothetical protein